LKRDDPNDPKLLFKIVNGQHYPEKKQAECKPFDKTSRVIEAFKDNFGLIEQLA
jgi:hypothetical protein